MMAVRKFIMLLHKDEVNENFTHSGPASSIRDGSEKVYHDVEDDILNSIHSVQPTIGDS